MKRLLLVIFLACTASGAVIAHDSCGIVVELREKYGPVITDTGTVLSTINECFVLTKYNKPAAWYPVANYAVKPIGRIECVK